MASPLNTALQNVKKKVIGATSDVLSAPARAYYGAKSKQAIQDANTLKTARKYKGAGNFTINGQPSPALMARTAADEVRQRRGALTK